VEEGAGGRGSVSGRERSAREERRGRESEQGDSDATQ
jgi:hypothetical protein